MADKKYIVMADVSVAMKAEFNESDIPEGVSPWEYAKEHMDGSEFEEVPNSGDWSVYDLLEIDETE